MVEVDYGGGGHRTRLRDQGSIVVSLGCPLPPYIKEQGGEAAGQEGRARRSPTPTGSRTPSLFLVGLGVEGKEVEERKERGGILLPVGVGLLLAPSSWPAAPPLWSFIYGGRGHP